MPSRVDLAKIHIAKKVLGLDDATYRRILRDRYRRTSAAELDERQAADLIELFHDKGWRPATLRQHSLIRLLWRRLAANGVIRHADETALTSFVIHATGRSEPRQLTVHEASRLIERLKKWLDRTSGGDRRH